MVNYCNCEDFVNYIATKKYYFVIDFLLSAGI
jgi:hypothetical protein